jgi:integrase
MAELLKRAGIAANVVAFAILTAARSGEVCGMRWGEIDREAWVWAAPADRIEAGKAHRVPLTPAALALLGKAGEPDALVFPGAAGTRPHCPT